MTTQSRNKREGRYAGKFRKLAGKKTLPRDCRTGPNGITRSFSLVEWIKLLEQI